MIDVKENLSVLTEGELSSQILLVNFGVHFDLKRKFNISPSPIAHRPLSLRCIFIMILAIVDHKMTFCLDLSVSLHVCISLIDLSANQLIELP